jgi:SAM-dependent methyltransferase
MYDSSAIEENGCVGYQCQDCGLIYISPMPNANTIFNLYGHDAAHVSAEELIESSSSYGKTLKARLALQYISKHVRTGDLLEIGPGGGTFLKEAARQGYRVFAAEFNPAQVAHIRSLGFDCRQGEFSKVFQWMTFDVIYHCDVLSHLLDPVSEFKAMRAMLKPGGVLVFETGNFGDVATKYYHLIDQWQCPTHLYFFSRRSLANLARASGFTLDTLTEYPRSLDMALGRLLKPAKSIIKGSVSTKKPSKALPKVGVKRKLGRLAMSLKHILDYVSIYRIGVMLPKDGRPQTVIVVFRPS